jgi:hypothetical protein
MKKDCSHVYNSAGATPLHFKAYDTFNFNSRRKNKMALRFPGNRVLQ